jgi:hypothetical protein
MAPRLRRRACLVSTTRNISTPQKGGGMAAVCETDRFRDLIARIPDRRSQIMAWETAAFIQVMQRWRNNLEAGEADPMLGASEQALRSIDFPVCVIPGNDRTHSVAAGRLVHSLIPGAKLVELRPDQIDVDLIPLSEWVPDEALAPVVVDVLRQFQYASSGRLET